MPKLDRGIFIYLEPRSVDGKDDFAQCGSCRMFVPVADLDDMEGSRCIIHGANQEIDEDDSCSFWVPWPEGKPVTHVIEDHAGEILAGVKASVTPEDSGLVSSKVQCRRCVQFDKKDSECELYEKLNELLPEVFDLDTSVESNACCNAWSDDKKVATETEAEEAAEGEAKPKKLVKPSTIASMKQSLKSV